MRAKVDRQVTRFREIAETDRGRSNSLSMKARHRWQPGTWRGDPRRLTQAAAVVLTGRGVRPAVCRSARRCGADNLNQMQRDLNRGACLLIGCGAIWL